MGKDARKTWDIRAAHYMRLELDRSPKADEYRERFKVRPFNQGVKRIIEKARGA